MKIVNSLTTTTWNKLFQVSRNRRLRRRQAISAPVNAAAEVLEVRTLLSAPNVTAVVSGGVLTLTSDNAGNHGVNVYRKDATHIEVDNQDGITTINGAALAVFAQSSITGITVNVGSGYDQYYIFSNTGAPALNVGAGGIVFQGVGGTGDHLEVFNNSSNAMTILGSITVQGSAVGSPLIHSGSSASVFNLYTASGSSLTVDGSVSISQKGTGTGSQFSQVKTEGAGNLTILGSVTETSTETSSGFQENYIYTHSTGNISIGQSVSQSGTGGSGDSFNQIYTNGSTGGNVSIGGAVTQVAMNSNYVENDIYSSDPGNLAINFSVSQTATSSSNAANNYLYVNGSGSVAVGAIAGGITQTATGANGTYNDIEIDSTGNLSVGGAVTQSGSSPGFVDNAILINTPTAGAGNVTTNGSVTQTGTSSGNAAENFVKTSVFGNITVGAVSGGITQTATGLTLAENEDFTKGSGSIIVGLSIVENATATAGHVENYVFDDGSGNIKVGPLGITINESNSASTGNSYNQVYTDSSGSLSTTGVITINATSNSGAATFTTQNEVYTQGSASGTISALGITISDSGSYGQENYVNAGGAAISIGILGITIIGSGSGYHDNEINTSSSNSPITIAGSVVVIDTGTGHSDFLLQTNNTNSPITVSGSVVYDNHLNSVGRSNVRLFGSTDHVNSILTVKGSVILTLALTSGTASDNDGAKNNEVDLGDSDGTNGTGYGAIVNGVTIITGGNGQDKVFIKEARLDLGTVISTLNNPSPGATWHDEVEIDGSSLGGTVIVAMSGPNAQMDINNGNGHQATVFSGLFEAILIGPSSMINVAAGTGSGFSHVTFSVIAIALGSPGAGDVFKYHAANVTGTILPVYFTILTV